MSERCLHYCRDRRNKLDGLRMSGLEMGETEIDRSENSGEETTSSHHMPLLLLFFVASGCAALIYEVVWFDLLRLVIGASSISAGSTASSSFRTWPMRRFISTARRRPRSWKSRRPGRSPSSSPP